MFAARAVHLTNHVEPQLRLVDGWCAIASSMPLCLSGGGRRLGLDNIRQLETMVLGARRPDLTVLLDLPVDQALRRRAAAQCRCCRGSL